MWSAVATVGVSINARPPSHCEPGLGAAPQPAKKSAHTESPRSCFMRKSYTRIASLADIFLAAAHDRFIVWIAQPTPRAAVSTRDRRDQHDFIAIFKGVRIATQKTNNFIVYIDIDE